MVVDQANGHSCSEAGVKEVFCDFTGGQVGHSDTTYCQGSKLTGCQGVQEIQERLMWPLGAPTTKDPVQRRGHTRVRDNEKQGCVRGSSPLLVGYIQVTDKGDV